MKSSNKSLKTTRDLESLVSVFSENEVLNLEEMSCVHGGDGEGNGGVPIIIIPPPPSGQTT